MPSMDAPTYYDRSKGIMPSRYDEFFKALSDEYTSDTGNVEAPTGWVGLVEVDMLTYNRVQSDQPWITDLPSGGWYIVRIDNNGLVWGLDYGGSGVHSEELARADFAEAEAVYAEWEEPDPWDESE